MREIFHLKSNHKTTCLFEMDESDLQLSLSSKDLERLNQIKNPTRKKEFIGVRQILHEIHKSSIEVLYQDKEPFYYLGSEKTYLSISHCWPFIGIQFSNKYKTGIDVEKTGRNFSVISHKYLTSDELKLMGNNLIIGWCVKEAAYKFCNTSHYSFLKDLEITKLNKNQVEVICKNDNIVLTLDYKINNTICWAYVTKSRAI